MTIEELFAVVLPKLTGSAQCSIVEAVREVQAIIGNRLLEKRSELLLSDVDARLSFAADDQSKYLPDDFRDVASRPFLEDGTKLSPLSNRNTADLQTAATPEFYQVRGRKFTLWPATDAAIVVQIPYFAKPEAPTGLEDELPFYGEFDEVFVDGCKAVIERGTSAVADRDFVALITSQVDAVLRAKDMAAEQMLADAINEM